MAATWLPPTWLQSSQIVLDRITLPAHPSGTYSLYQTADSNKETKTWKNTLAYPAGVAVVSAFVLTLQLIACSTPVRKILARISKADIDGDGADDIKATGSNGQPRSHVAKLGGPVIYGFKVVRFLSTLAPLGLSIATLILSDRNDDSEYSFDSRWVSFGLIGTYTYVSLLGFASLVSNLHLSRLVTRHLVTVLLMTWAVYVYRDLWPLATFTLQPADASEGSLLWAKVSVLTFAAVIIPLVVPRQYIPVDPKDPSEKANPEQTASILSMSVFTWLDNIIWKAYKVPHLPYEELLPIANYDCAKHLVARAFPILDPFQAGKRRHVFWNLMIVFRWEYTVLSMLILLRVVATFTSPIGIYQLLQYHETDGEGAVVCPWVWISWLFFGPILGSAAFQYYIFNSTRMLVRCKAIITQLIFDHSLRIRMKAETMDTPAPSRATTAAQTPDNVSIAGPDPTEADAGSTSSSGSEDETTKTKEAAPEPKELTPTGNLIGRINNLASTDLNNLVDGRDFLFVLLYAPLQAGFSVFFLYSSLGWSAFVGMIAMILLFPIPGYIASKIQGVQQDKMKKTDARVQNVTETMSVIRMIKLFGWEARVADRLADKREGELLYIRKYKLLELINGNINFMIPIVTIVGTFATYTLAAGQVLTASRVFLAMAVFDILHEQLHMLFGYLPPIIQAKVSLDRITDFLNKTELLNDFDEKDATATKTVVPPRTVERDVIGVRGTSFTWSKDNDGSRTPGTPGPNHHNFTLHIKDEVMFGRGRINLILGPTGSGKTSLLMALLGELHYIPNGPDSYVSLPCVGDIAYAAQESWVQNETIKDNVLFGAPYDEERYNQVLEQCALKRDLSLFDAGDLTEVGKKGLTLSRGQKARITLARAVYSKAEILLLDDMLAALDVHTAWWIVDKCFKGDLLRGRTVILVTHNMAITSPIADFVVSLGTDGCVATEGTLSKTLVKDQTLSREFRDQHEELKKNEGEVGAVEPIDEAAPKKGDGKLIVAEESSEGHTSWQALRLYLSSMASGYTLLFWLRVLVLLVVYEVFYVAETWWLGYWAQQYEDNNPSEVNVA
ncbi:hypothetical protein BD311DRAFT_811015 [Dichomitus squalens]|uniref:P-loop containing nucleoside triphosphate hydrolase protein n=1 Tax=Dichomitus squalens TaxID=114155 RepID=A0A4Q9MBP8_9APHY|nr:hypothetical protein BD311DRAFT_811015 [Dichomitus squalens]